MKYNKKNKENKKKRLVRFVRKKFSERERLNRKRNFLKNSKIIIN
jgi:hypothetical protein